MKLARNGVLCTKPVDRKVLDTKDTHNEELHKLVVRKWEPCNEEPRKLQDDGGLD